MTSAWLVLAVLLGGVPSSGGEPPPDPAKPPRFASAVDAVYVDVFVERGGAPVGGLAAPDFEVKDEGARQDVELVDHATLPLDVVLVLDMSASIQGEKLLALRSAGGAFLDVLRSGSRTALLGFNQDIVLLSPLGPDRAVLRHALEAMRPVGSSAVLDGLFSAIGLVGRARALVVLFSDGEDNMSWLSADEVRAAAERSNTIVHVIGFVPAGPPGGAGRADPGLLEVRQPGHVRDLRRIAEATGGRFWGAESTARIRERFATVAAEVDARYVLRFEPKGGARPGWHRLDVRLKGRKGTVHARRGYFVAPATDVSDGER